MLNMNFIFHFLLFDKLNLEKINFLFTKINLINIKKIKNNINNLINKIFINKNDNL